MLQGEDLPRWVNIIITITPAPNKLQRSLFHLTDNIQVVGAGQKWTLGNNDKSLRSSISCLSLKTLSRVESECEALSLPTLSAYGPTGQEPLGLKSMGCN
jgi:hypothetical protein